MIFLGMVVEAEHFCVIFCGGGGRYLNHGIFKGLPKSWEIVSLLLSCYLVCATTFAIKCIVSIPFSILLESF